MVTIVTDTSVGYSKAELISRKVISVSLTYVISGIAYSEKCRGENGQFSLMMKDRKLMTSQPSPDAFTEAYEQALEQSDEVLCITLSGKLSGTYSCAQKAAEKFGGRVRVFDSQTVNGGMHLLVDEAVNMAVAGLGAQAICDNLEEIRKKIHTVFSVETLEPLRCGGRLTVPAPNPTLNSRPILGCDESITFITNVRGIKARMRTLCQAVPDNARRIFVMKSGENTSSAELESMLSARFPSVKIHVRIVGPVLTVHLGEGAVGVAYLTN